jgi:RNA polymerase sigma factor (TIGR02999 family)
MAGGVLTNAESGGKNGHSRKNSPLREADAVGSRTFRKPRVRTTSPQDVTQILINWHIGDADAPAKLMPLVYEELRRLARNYLQRERADHTLQATALVHEAYLRLVDDNSVTWKDRAHFYGIAARLMRRILVDHARAHNAAKRGGLEQKLTLDEARDLPTTEAVELVALDGALESFAQTYPRKSEVVELKFFGGLDMKEISKILEVSEKTVLRDWNFAKLWLCRELNEHAA